MKTANQMESLMMQPQTAVSAYLGLVCECSECGVAPGVDQQLLADQQLQLFLLSYTRQASGLV